MPLNPTQTSDKSAVPHSSTTQESDTTQPQPDAGRVSTPAAESLESHTPEPPELTSTVASNTLRQKLAKPTELNPAEESTGDEDDEDDDELEGFLPVIEEQEEKQVQEM